MFNYTFTLKGQIPSGKNAITITRKGLRFPNKRFLLWRNEGSRQLQFQKLYTKFGKIIDKPVSIIIDYYKGDLRRRDVPGMLDALWHLLEYNKIITDDKWLGEENCEVIFKNKGLDRKNPRVEITIKD